MKPLENANPLAVFVYFFCTVFIVSFNMNPLLLVFSFAGAVILLPLVAETDGVMTVLRYFALFIVMAAINPLFNHNGVTVLFIMNNNPVTLEAVIYGLCASFMIITVLLWMRIFTIIMTADKLLCLFGTVSPKLALLLSMTLRYIPLFVRQTKKVSIAQKGLGLVRDDSIPGKIRAGLRVFSIMVTWGLENGIVTADSMTSRGYGTGRRTYYSPFRFTACDALLLAVSVALFAVTMVAAVMGELDFEFYPRTVMSQISAMSAAAYASCGVFSLLPSIIRIKENVKWKYLQSKI